MTEPILDRLDREHGGGARRYVANLFVVGGASRAQVAAALARKYSIPAPTTRSVTAWRSKDPELKKMIAELEAIKAETSPDDPTLPELSQPVNIERVDGVLFDFLSAHPAFAALLFRGRVAPNEQTPAAETTVGRDWWREPSTYGGPERVSEDIAPAVLAVLVADYDTPEDFDAACEALLPDDWDSHVEPTPGAGILEPVE
jgi:hypothetical protein